MCSYDRAGFGLSDPSPSELSFEDGARDLKALLTAAEVPGPYILVGHSKGGLQVRTHARLYPDDVVGVLLLDDTEERHIFPQMEFLEEISASALGPCLIARVGVVRLLPRLSPRDAPPARDSRSGSTSAILGDGEARLLARVLP
jgi:pimeloyl-ACP methyl ester carboxylesterase